MRPSSLRGVGLVSAFLVWALFLVAKAQNVRPAAQQDERTRAIDVVRVINTAEYEYRRDHGSFAVWPELFASGAVGKAQKEVARWTAFPISAGSQVIPGYFLNLLVSRDSTLYSVSLHEAGSNDCGFSVFSNESGLIYQGTIVDCPRVGDPPFPSNPPDKSK